MRIRGTKFCLYGEYAECIFHSRKNLALADNTRNEILRILIIRKFEYLGEFEAKIKNTLGGYSGALMGSFGQTSLK